MEYTDRSIQAQTHKTPQHTHTHQHTQFTPARLCRLSVQPRRRPAVAAPLALPLVGKRKGPGRCHWQSHPLSTLQPRPRAGGWELWPLLSRASLIGAVVGNRLRGWLRNKENRTICNSSSVEHSLCQTFLYFLVLYPPFFWDRFAVYSPGFFFFF